MLEFVPADYQVECGAGLGNCSRPKKDKCDNVTLNKDAERGNSKSYTLKRLARDSEPRFIEG